MTLIPPCRYTTGIEDNHEGSQTKAYTGPTRNLQIKVPGHIGESWSDWAGGMTITVESEGDGPSITTLTGTVADQATLQDLLRRLTFAQHPDGTTTLTGKIVDRAALYGVINKLEDMGLSLISVNEVKKESIP